MDNTELTGIFNDACIEVYGRKIYVEARFYKYSTIKSTIRKKGDMLAVKVSDILDDAPLNVIESLAIILFSKMRRRPVEKSISNIYRSWINSEYVLKKSLEYRKERVNNVKINPIGNTYNLIECFESLNNIYFKGILSRPKLTWSAVKTYRKLGHYDPSRHLISISRTLDSIKVPKFVLDYVLYHEMLHIIHDSKYTGKSQVVHHRKFRDDEKGFARFNDAKRWISQARFF